MEREEYFTDEEIIEFKESDIPEDKDLQQKLFDSLCYQIYTLSSMPIGNIAKEYIPIFEKLGEAGFAKAYYVLGLIFYKENTMDRDLNKSYEYHKRAAEMGDPDAQFEMYIYTSEGMGCDANESKALEWNRKAAENGHYRALSNMGVFFFNGAEGIDKDIKQGIEWFEKAIEAGSSSAAAALSAAYRFGDGVEKDEERANHYDEKYQQARRKEGELLRGRLYLQI